jgi:hypothetical protein
MLLALPLTLIKKKRPLDFNFAYFLILPILIYLVFRYLIPLPNTRYLYNLLGIGMLIGIYLARILKIPQRVIISLVVISALASLPELAKRQELAASVLVTVILFLLLPFLLRKPNFILYFMIIMILSLPLWEKDYLRNEYPRYVKMVKYSGFWPDATRAWNWLNTNTTGNNVAYVGRPVPFPLYGSNFKNNVYYVSVNKTQPAKLHYFPNSHYQWGYDFLSLHKNLEAKGNYRGDADYDIWVHNLSKLNTDYLFVYSLHQTKETLFPMEDGWAKSHPEKFVPVFGNETIHVYKIAGSR